MVVITNSLLVQLAANSAAVKTFPFLRLRRPPGPGCCGAAARPVNYNNVKMKIALLTGDRLVQFKALLNADKIKVVYLNGIKNSVEKVL